MSKEVESGQQEYELDEGYYVYCKECEKSLAEDTTKVIANFMVQNHLNNWKHLPVVTNPRKEYGKS